MKILVLSHMYPSTFNEAAGNFVHEQVKALVEKGVEVQVISLVPWTPFPINRMSQKWRAYSEIPAESVWDGIKVLYPRYLSFPRAWFYASSGKRMHQGIKNVVARIHQSFPFDLIHAHVALPDGNAGMRLAQDYGRPLVITIHGQDLQHTVDRDTACRRAVARAVEVASRTVLVSNKLRQLAVRHFGQTNTYAVIPNGVDPRSVVSCAQARTSQHSRELVLLSVSNLVQTKGLDLNLRALQRLIGEYPDLRYQIVGGGSEESKLRTLTKKLGLESSVEFLGRLPHSQVMKQMAACDVFTLPSWNEGFGVVYLEAMASGRPVIGCAGEGIEDFVEHGKSGLLVKPRDIDSLVTALDYLLSNPGEARAIGERARNLVLENYTWEGNAAKTIKVYEEVLIAH